jgi:hypothetical protein
MKGILKTADQKLALYKMFIVLAAFGPARD